MFSLVLIISLHLTVQLSLGLPTVAPFPDVSRVEYPDAVKSESFHWIPMMRHPNCKSQGKNVRITTVFVPVYYMSTHNVALDCAACSDEQIYNGEVKVWRSVPEAQMFRGMRNVMDTRYWLSLHESLELINDNEGLAGVPEERRTRMTQVGSRLYLISASMFAAGMYNCYPEGFAFETRQIVYVVLPMIYPMRFQHLFAYVAKTFVQEKTHWWWPFRGSHLKQQQKLFAAFFYPVTHVRDQLNPTWNELLFPIKPPRGYKFEEMSQRISLGGLASMNLRIELKWEQWSPCTACRPYKSLRTRQGHCYLSKIVLNKSVSMPNFESADMTNFYGTKMVMTGVVDDLNILFNQEPFSLEGVRCWSVIPLIAGLDAYGSPCTAWTGEKVFDTRTSNFVRNNLQSSKFLRRLLSKQHDSVDERKLTRKFDKFTGCLLWFHNLFHTEFTSTDFRTKWGNFFFPQTAQEIAAPDWNNLYNIDRMSLRKEKTFKLWLDEVNKKIPRISKSGYVPLCGSAGYYIDYQRCEDTACENDI